MTEWKIDITKAESATIEQAIDEYYCKGMAIWKWAYMITSEEFQPAKHGLGHDELGFEV